MSENPSFAITVNSRNVSSCENHKTQLLGLISIKTICKKCFSPVSKCKRNDELLSKQLSLVLSG